jgi:CRP-like cAMP-binding protein
VLDGEVEILQLRSEAEITVTQKMTVQPNNEGLFLVPITRVPSGGYFGERALEHSEPRSAAAKALTKSDLIVINGDTYKSILSAIVKHVDLSKHLTFKSACRRVLTQKQSARTEEDLQVLAEVRTQ